MIVHMQENVSSGGMSLLNGYHWNQNFLIKTWHPNEKKVHFEPS